MSSSVRTVEKLRSKQKELEKSWNSNMSTQYESRRLAQMSEDIKTFIVRSMSDPIETQRVIEQSNRRRKEANDSFSTIASALNFHHHEGTDRNLELKVVKIIMVREGLIMSLKYMSDKVMKNKSMEGSSILELLSQIRESTLNYLEALCLWRQASNQNEHPRAFLWENQNYTLKLIVDMDFLSENPILIAALRVEADQLRSNPLMLSNNLEDMNTWMDPHDRAVQDTQGNINGPEFESRLRLRYAERVLLQEQEFYSTTDVDVFLTQQEETGIPYPGHQQQQQQPQYYYNGDNNAGQGNNYNDYYQEDGLKVGSTVLEGEFDEIDDNDMRLETYNSNAPNSSAPNGGRSYFEAERRVKTTESAQHHPQSRSSTASYGFNSAPSTSHGNRMDSGGHDFFTGHWGENPSNGFPFFDGEGNSLSNGADNGPNNIAYSNKTQRGSDIDDDEEMFTAEPPMYGEQVVVGGNSVDDEQGSLQRSVRSIDSIGDLNVKAFYNISPPPKVAVIAGSICLILFTPGDVVPNDLSWSAFIRLCKKFNLPDLMSNFSPELVSKVKVLALQPILEQMVDEDAVDHLRSSSNMSYPEYISLTKLLIWVKQVTNSALKRQGGAAVDSNDPNKKKKKQTSPFKIRLIKDSELEEMRNARRVNKAPPRNKLAPIQNEEKAAKEEGTGKSKSRGAKHIKAAEADPLAHPTSKKKVIPKVVIELASYHEQRLEGKTKNPLLLSLMTTPENIVNNSVRDVHSVEESRLVVKVFDTVESHEVLIHVNMREYLLFREDLVHNLHERVHEYFDPTDLLWWKAHIHKIVNVKSRSPLHELRLTISKKAIEELLRHQMEKDGMVLESNRHFAADQDDLTSVSNETLSRSNLPTPTSLSTKRAKSKSEPKKPIEAAKPTSKAGSAVSGSRATSKAEAQKPASGKVKPGSKPATAEKPKPAPAPTTAPVKAASPNISRKPSERIEPAKENSVRMVVEDERPSSVDDAPLYEEEDFEVSPTYPSKPSTAFTVKTNIEEYSSAEEHNYDSAYDTDFEPLSKPVTAAPTPHVNPSQSLSEVDYEEDFDQKSSELKPTAPAEKSPQLNEESLEYQDDFAKLSVVEAKEEPLYEDEFEETKEVKPVSSLAAEIAREEENDANYESDFDAAKKPSTTETPAGSLAQEIANEEEGDAAITKDTPASNLAAEIAGEEEGDAVYENDTDVTKTAETPASNLVAEIAGEEENDTNYESDFDAATRAATAAPTQSRNVESNEQDTSAYFETSVGTLHVSADMEEQQKAGTENEQENVGIANDDDSLYNMDLDNDVGSSAVVTEKAPKQENGDDDSLFNDPDFENGPEVEE